MGKICTTLHISNQKSRLLHCFSVLATCSLLWSPSIWLLSWLDESSILEQCGAGGSDKFSPFDSARVAFLSQNWNDKKANGAFVTVANRHIYRGGRWSSTCWYYLKKSRTCGGRWSSLDSYQEEDELTDQPCCLTEQMVRGPVDQPASAHSDQIGLECLARESVESKITMHCNTMSVCVVRY